jgi:hypothetical protein
MSRKRRGIPGIIALGQQNIRTPVVDPRLWHTHLRVVACACTRTHRLPDGQGRLYFSLMGTDRMGRPFSVRSSGTVGLSKPGAEGDPAVRHLHLRPSSLGAQTMARSKLDYNLAASQFSTDGSRDRAAKRTSINTRIGLDYDHRNLP